MDLFELFDLKVGENVMVQIEAYVELALLDQEHRSDYLVCDTHSFVYPLGEQREYPNRSIKSLMEVAIPYIINSIQGAGRYEL
ncbi:hypothetical protein IGA_05763 [Bacillus cereus HuA3-9]|uniref:Uncharacterized protein n=1 Tax=Bacillus cereus HuA3-9 TaxID=1053205 RepID=R8CI08_BACCE|nr:hypothetical protein IGA_05763 [Bacillus cereus HuA3-9]